MSDRGEGHGLSEGGTRSAGDGGCADADWSSPQASAPLAESVSPPPNTGVVLWRCPDCGAIEGVGYCACRHRVKREPVAYIPQSLLVERLEALTKWADLDLGTDPDSDWTRGFKAAQSDVRRFLTNIEAVRVALSDDGPSE